MAQYIDKTAIVAVIEEWVNGWSERLNTNPSNPSFFEGGIELGKHILSFLDTIEVKEVDLEKEIDGVIYNYKLDNHRHTSICSADIEWIAKHFFELGQLSNKK